jgi:uncharacterized protein YnzC (UPF0291/DUF896 family)
MSSMDQSDINRISTLAQKAKTDPTAAAKLRAQVKKRLDRLKAQRPAR